MIGIFDDAGDRLAITFNAPPDLVLNDPTDDPTDTYQVSTVSVADQIDYVADPHPERDGMELYGARKVQKLIVIEGVIHAPTLARLFDKKYALAKAFDPAWSSARNGWLLSERKLSFYRPTEDTTTWPTGLMSLYYKARGRGSSFPISSQVTGNSALFRLELIASDPRAYSNAGATTVTGLGPTATVSDFPTWGSWTIPMLGAGSATFTITLGSDSLVLNLSGRSNGQTVYVYPETRQIFVNATETPSLYVSGSWNRMIVGSLSKNLSYSNTTNVDTSALTFSYTKAWCV